MIEFPLIALYAIHVLCAIVWFGGALYSLLILTPALAGISPSSMSEIGARLGSRSSRIMPLAAIGTISAGTATAIVSGRFSDLWTALDQPYGKTAAIALLVSVFMYIWGKVVVEARVHAMQESPPHLKADAMKRVTNAIQIVQVGFVMVFVCMVLMRFGY